MATTANSMTTRAERRTAAAQRVAPTLRNISTRDVTLLAKLAALPGRSWARVRDVGGQYHSWHANALAKLSRHELVERTQPGSGAGMAYRINGKGRRLLRAVRKVDDRV